MMMVILIVIRKYVLFVVVWMVLGSLSVFVVFIHRYISLKEYNIGNISSDLEYGVMMGAERCGAVGSTDSSWSLKIY